MAVHHKAHESEVPGNASIAGSAEQLGRGGLESGCHSLDVQDRDVPLAPLDLAHV